MRAGSIEEVQAAVRAHARLRPVGGRTKPALSLDATPVLLDVTALSGVIEYSAAECTFTARAGTTIAEIEGMLARDGLYLPFEPPFGPRGATLGGTVAAGLSGPGRLRYGGVRDFLLGIRFVDGEGRVAHGGGRVVKNAAGFSVQHLLLGSLGRLGVLVELTFKVFPRAPAHRTIAAAFPTLGRAVDALVRLRRSPFEVDAAELLPPSTPSPPLASSAPVSALPASSSSMSLATGTPAPSAVSHRDDASTAARDAASETMRDGNVATREDAAARLDARSGPTLIVRLTGIESALAARVAVLTTFLAADRVDALGPEESASFWHDARELTWIQRAGASSIKVPMTPGRLERFDAQLSADTARRYGAGGDVAWLAWPGPLDPLHRLLHEQGLAGLVIDAGTNAGVAAGTASGDAASAAAPLIGAPADTAFLARARQALDPRGVFA